MTRYVDLVAKDSDVAIIIDSKQTGSFRRDRAISAQEMFDALDFHPGDTYELQSSDCGNIPKGSFDPLKELVRSILDGVNALGDSSGEVANGDVSITQSDRQAGTSCMQ